MKVFFANTRHYIEHLLPIYKAYTKEKMFLVPKELKDASDIKPSYYNNQRELLIFLFNLEQSNKDLTYVVASYGNVRTLSQKGFPIIKFILIEHGAGQTYISDVPGWKRGSFKGSERIKLYLGTNSYCTEAFEENNPLTQCYTIGCPKTDSIKSEVPNLSRPLVVFSWHWDCSSVPETKSGFSYWQGEVLKIHQDDNKNFRIAIHGHPRIQDQTILFARKHNIDFIRTFDSVIKEADIYVVDNSSTIYEFAITTKPVIILNNPFYRRDVNHGLRFWELSDIGLHCNSLRDLRDNIDFIIDNGGDKMSNVRKREILDKVYPNLGYSTKKAISCIISADNII